MHDTTRVVLITLGVALLMTAAWSRWFETGRQETGRAESNRRPIERRIWTWIGTEGNDYDGNGVRSGYE